MPSITAGARPTLQHGGRMPSGQIPCQQGVLASSSEKEMGNRFYALLGGIIGCEGFDWEAQEDLTNFDLVF